MNSRPVLIIIHLLCCLTFLALPYIFDSDGGAKLAQLTHNPHEQRNFLSYLLTIAFFYANFYYLIPGLFFARKYALYGLSVVGCLLLIEGVLTSVNRQGFRSRQASSAFPPDRMGERASPFGNDPPQPDRPGPPPGGPPPAMFWNSGPQRPGLPTEWSQTFFLFVVSFLLSLALRINNRWQATERERLQTELSYLKAQINPHFLFNTLNSIYSLAIEQSVHTADALVKLSSFLRYIIQDTQQDWVPVRNELEYIGHYLALQKLRLDGTVQIDFTVEGAPNGHRIAPLILISFIENAFKYGVNPEEPSLIQIRLVLREQELNCHVFNKKVRLVHDPAMTSSGIGLANTKARLALLYPNQHRLLIQDKPEDFTVDLAITLL